MTAINGLILLDQETERSNLFYKKLSILVKKLTLKTSEKEQSGYGYGITSIEGKLTKGEYQKTVDKVWEEDLKEFELKEDFSIFLSSKQIYIHENIVSLILGTKENFQFNENPSKIISEKGFLASIPILKQQSPSLDIDFNIVSFNLKKPTQLSLYRGILPFRILYSFEFSALLFTSNHRNIEIFTQDDLLQLRPYLPLNLPPYSSYLIDQKKITFVDQELIYSEDFCCTELTQELKKKQVLFDFLNGLLYLPDSSLKFPRCPYCGTKMKDLFELS